MHIDRQAFEAAGAVCKGVLIYEDQTSNWQLELARYLPLIQNVSNPNDANRNKFQAAA